MALESQFTEEQLFDQLISSIVHSVWVALGKIKNPLSDTVERDLTQASVSIDMLDMLFKRMDGNLSDREDQYLGHLLSELKMNYIDEKKKGDSTTEEKPDGEKGTEPGTAQEPVKAKEETRTKTQAKAAPKKSKKPESKTPGKKSKATPRKKTAKKPKE